MTGKPSMGGTYEISEDILQYQMTPKTNDFQSKNSMQMKTMKTLNSKIAIIKEQSKEEELKESGSIDQ